MNNASGTQNTAVGDGALENNTVSENAAFGYQALNANTSGNQNTAMGWEALVANDDGISNTAVGYRSLHTNITGDFNTAVGQNALLLSTGDENTALAETFLLVSVQRKIPLMPATGCLSTTMMWIRMLCLILEQEHADH